MRWSTTPNSYFSPTIPENDFSKYLTSNNSRLGYGTYNASRAKCINVLLIGRSQVGKSTIVEVLLNPQKGTYSNGFSITKVPHMQSLIVTDEQTDYSYQINIVDTPGFGQVRENNENPTDDDVLKCVSRCIEHNINWLNVVCFVTKAKETNRLDVPVFKKLWPYLGPSYADTSMMVVTHCEGYTADERVEIIENIRTHTITKEYYDYCKLGTYCFGAIDVNKVNEFKEKLRPMIVEDKLVEIETMRDTFITKIIEGANTKKTINELKQIHDEMKC
ncbi:unnamed protein product [Oppiella nova]|uniref:AIG1-type G domain-containing protein n=1 Tax=Oppiella nova TaxID=334625 RepID=A0A7R9M7E6_9ACAR|nr:unnamed protein product [Oppiella nova]CAG2172031.1 unnamed protein product [Oppiella nova]